MLDLSRVLAGPWAGQMLADLRRRRDQGRAPRRRRRHARLGPALPEGRAGRDTGEAAYFLCANRNKRSVTIDIATPEGAGAGARSWRAQADVVVENFKVGGLAQYGLDYESLAALNPRLIYCSITGFGQTGPLCARAPATTS